MDFEDDVEPPSRWVKMLYYLWKIFTCLFLHLFLIAVVVGYCFFGAYLFERLEHGFEAEMKKNISYIRGNITEDIWKFTQGSAFLEQQNWTSSVRDKLRLFETQLIWAMRKGGWDGDEDEKSLKWTPTGALFYSIIVITTIGYGHIAPKTAEGKIATIFYAVVGIPLMLLCLSNIGDVMAHSFRFLYWRICCYKCTQPPKRLPPPIGFPRRTRSFRGGGTVRSQHGGSRFSGRSRTTSFRQSGGGNGGGRHSQRSADSAIGGMSDGYTRSSYSDTECRYYDEMEREHAMLGAEHRRAGGDGDRSFNRQSQQSRYSDNVTMYHHSHTMPHQSRRHNMPGIDSGGEFPTNSPVLYNKYALEREDSRRLRKARMEQQLKFQRREHLPPLRSGEHLSPPRSRDHLSPTRSRDHLSPPRSTYHQQPSPSLRRNANIHTMPMPSRMNDIPPKYRKEHHHTMPGRAVKENIGPSPRIMTPLGFAVRRQTFPRPPRDHTWYNDYYDYYYDYGDMHNAPDYTKPVPIWLCVFLVVSYIIGGAFLFDRTEEDWGFFNSAYFCFITLTTIGFGDYVPQQKVGPEAQLGIAICSLYLLFGIALLAMSFNLVQEEVINNVKSVARHLGIIKDEDSDD